MSTSFFKLESRSVETNQPREHRNMLAMEKAQKQIYIYGEIHKISN